MNKNREAVRLTRVQADYLVELISDDLADTELTAVEAVAAASVLEKIERVVEKFEAAKSDD